MPAGSNWTLGETEAAFALYMAIPTARIRRDSPEVIALAGALGRTVGSVHLKLWNIASNDPNRLSMGRSGMAHAGRWDSAVWDLYREGGSDYVARTAAALDALEGGTVTRAIGIDLPEGKERAALVAQRVNQDYFRNTLLANYGGRCCLSGLSSPALLLASHIKPWSVSDPRTERTNPANGLLLNALLDSAFDRGLMTLDPGLRAGFSPALREDPSYAALFAPYEGRRIELPAHMPPAPEFLEYHREVIFARTA